MRATRWQRRRRSSKASIAPTTPTTRRWSRSTRSRRSRRRAMPSRSGRARRARPSPSPPWRKALGIPENRVKFNDMLLGGGFGRRGNRDVEFIVDSVLMSKAAGRPVKVMWTREDDVRNGRFRPLYVNRIRAGPRRVGQDRRLASPRGVRRGARVHGPGALQDHQGPRQHRDARHGAADLRDSGPAGRRPAAGNRHAHQSAARDRRRAEQLRQRGLHRRARREAGRGPGRIPPAPARHDAARAARAPRDRRGGEDGRLEQEAPGARPRDRVSRLLRHAAGRRRRGLGGPGERRDQGARLLVHDRLRRRRAAGQRDRADRELDRLRAGARADRAHHHRGRRGAAVELLRLPGAAACATCRRCTSS